MFDLSIGVVRTKLLTDKAHGEGYPVQNDQSDFVKKAINIIGSQLWKKAGRTRLGETSMKMLIAQEMSTAIELKEKAPGIVAKLMGLNSLPVQQKIPPCRRNSQETDPHSCPSRAPQQESNFSTLKCRTDSQIHEKKYKDVYEVQMENEDLQEEGNYCRNLTEKRMALVHQKFIEAKRLATNERLLQSKEFKDALEVLNSNKDLFLKLLEDPNSLFSNQLKDLHQTTSLGTQSKCITVLKPTTTTSIDINHEKFVSKNRHVGGEEIRDVAGHDLNSCFLLPKAETASPPTRIVVLKAVSAIPHEAQASLASHISLPVPENRNIRSSEAANISHKMPKNSKNSQKDEYQRASALSNGYAADESSLSRSETDYREAVSDCSDSELVTPTSQNSWVHMISGSPGSLSSLSHEYYSLESSVSREAKKRLSERLESLTSDDIGHEQAKLRKSSSTLGEMLAIPEIKKEEGRTDRIMSTCSFSDRMQEFNKDSPKNFRSSESLPAPPNFESVRENEKKLLMLSSESFLLKQASKLKNEKSSFKDKVSGLIFSGMKKLVRVKPNLSTSSANGRLHLESASSVQNGLPKSSLDRISDANASKTSEDKFAKALSSMSVSGTEKHGNVSFKNNRSVEKLWKSEVFRENSNQHNHVSALERPFQEEFPCNVSYSSQRAITNNPQALSRSPLISSVSRSSNLENPHFETSLPNSLKLFRLFFKEDEEHERFDFITKLLSSSNFANESSSAILARFHSLHSPLDPVLLDELLDRKGEEAKCRERRSNQRLYFDFVNETLKDICYCTLVDAFPWSTTATRTQKHVQTNLTVKDEVWCRLKDCFCAKETCSSSKAEYSKQNLGFLVKKEVAGSGLGESMWLEMDELSKEIGEMVLEELFDATVAELTGRFL
ncbi:intracellular protein transport protein USO1-like [Phalaenopsis equestris]|uniref:intracellular protein transport protein USO1-like n=1 Tax=Phalaenopsis equestris TaxID=78828 RepID=UPI0009E1C605|nr:intracellular protein transport protein USO1-like [Phalaenopsis equestris]XP_020581815.1 intracellular protein transport protein USO1-like [Phalaenopsis equestris]XP_020581824.1 intracellular protein transport protein USO1-like [Phalaenopsis equestris]